MSAPRPVTVNTRYDIERAIVCLRAARDAAKAANCPKLTAKIRSALKSAGGAERHLSRRQRFARGEG